MNPKLQSPLSAWQIAILSRTRRPSTVPVAQFADHHRRMLRDLGLLDQQVLALEGVLPVCQRLLGDSASLQDVREELDGIAGMTERLLLGLTRLQRAEGGAPEEAYTRLLIASIDDVDLVGALCAGLGQLQQVVAHARMSLGREQRRPKQLGWLVVGIIDRSLRDAEADSARFAPSYSMGSTFRQAVGVFIDAATNTQGSDPERAIKAYVRWVKGGRTPDGLSF